MTIPGIENPDVPYGSLIVISGVSGFIGSHVADQALEAGYRVRGTTRDVRKSAWIKQYFEKKYGLNVFELAEVPDMTIEDAFDEAAQGAAGFIHVANDMTHDTNPQVAIPRAVDGALNALKSLSKQPGQKRFVYTSSSFAATLPKPGKKFTISADTFNEESVDRAWKPNADGATVYAASKVAAERAITSWVEEHEPLVTVNMICPNGNIGEVLSPANQGYPTSASWVKSLWDMDYRSVENTPPQHFVNVKDDARLHIIALADPAVRDERIFPIAGPVNMNDIVRILRRISPQRSWPDLGNDDKDVSTFEAGPRGEELLVSAYGTGYSDLEESVRANAAALQVLS